jgi:predicted permease
MSWLIFSKLLNIFLVGAIGWFVGRMRWLGHADASGGDPARVLSRAAFYIFVPALMFRTTSRVDFADLPWAMLYAFFGPLLLLILGTYALQRWRGQGRTDVAVPAVRATTASFGNTVQVGIPLAASLFGEAGLAIHVTVMSLHALTILTLLTALIELDLARERARTQSGVSLLQTLALTVRNTVVHPVVLPIIAGLLCNALGLRPPAFIDELLQLLATAVVPLCLTLTGMSIAYYGWPKVWQGIFGTVALKLLLFPAMVLVLAHWGLGLSGMPLNVVVMMAALPTGTNALIFAQRYRSLEAETTAATVLSTLLFMLSAPLWLWLLSKLEAFP